jgi:hypothetical protein
MLNNDFCEFIVFIGSLVSNHKTVESRLDGFQASIVELKSQNCVETVWFRSAARSNFPE